MSSAIAVADRGSAQRRIWTRLLTAVASDADDEVTLRKKGLLLLVALLVAES